MSETNNKLEIKNLSKRFGEKILFENLSLTVDGPAVLWAPSGWGKTTLLRILMGLGAPAVSTCWSAPPPAAWRAWAGSARSFRKTGSAPS